MPNQRLVVRCFMMSVDGYSAGLNQRLELPFGDHAQVLTEWIFATKAGNEMIGRDGGAENADNDYLVHAFDGIGAVILGRNMYAPSRGPWTDDGWTGWWGPNPPYHAPTFILTHHEHEPIEMEGGTTFHFATGGIHDTLERAFAAANGGDVRLMGGADVISQYLAAGLVDEMHLVVVPVLVGNGERPFPVASPPPAMRCVEHVATESVIHLRFVRE